MGSLAIACALRGNPIGATAWGNAMLLAGSALFLASTQERWVSRAVLCAILFCSGLPLTLTAAAWTSGGLAKDLLLPAFLLAQAMMLAGFLHFTWTAYAVTPLPAAALSLRGFYRSGIVLPSSWLGPGSGVGLALCNWAIGLLQIVILRRLRSCGKAESACDRAQWAGRQHTGKRLLGGGAMEAGFQTAASRTWRLPHLEGEAGTF
jgi:hypothetical protein